MDLLVCYNQTCMKILGIETSCDETAAAVVEDGTKMLSNEIASQVEIHARYGGLCRKSLPGSTF